MYAHNTWHSSTSGMKCIFPRRERGFVVSSARPETVCSAFLCVSGIVFQVFINGHRLRRGKAGFIVSPAFLKPWENEIHLYGWPRSARLTSDGEPLPAPSLTIERATTGKEHETDPLMQAADALNTFIVAEGTDRGDMFSFYDPVDGAFRLSRWRWDTGICLEALSRLAQTRDCGRHLNNIKRLADRFIDIQLKDQLCHGGFSEVIDPHIAKNRQTVLPEWVVPFNGAFIGSGLIAASELFPDEKTKYLQAARHAHTLMTTKGINGEGLLRGYYHTEEQTWLYHGQINDSGIFPRFSGQLYEEGLMPYPDPVITYARAYCRFMQAQGYAGRAFFFQDEKELYPSGTPLFPEWKNNPERLPAKIFARGQAWAILGLNSAWMLSQDEQIGKNVKLIIEYLLDRQRSDGCWVHDLRHPERGVDIKATAVIGWALCEAETSYRTLGGDAGRLKEAIQQTWKALTANQEKFRNADIPGALLDEGEEGAIIYYRNRPMYTAYASAAFILMGLLLEGKA